MWVVIADTDKCNGDEECAKACSAQVFEMAKGESEPVNMINVLGVKLVLTSLP